MLPAGSQTHAVSERYLFSRMEQNSKQGDSGARQEYAESSSRRSAGSPAGLWEIDEMPRRIWEGEPKAGIEPATYCLRNNCSTTELLRRRLRLLPHGDAAAKWKNVRGQILFRRADKIQRLDHGRNSFRIPGKVMRRSGTCFSNRGPALGGFSGAPHGVRNGKKKGTGKTLSPVPSVKVVSN